MLFLLCLKGKLRSGESGGACQNPAGVCRALNLSSNQLRRTTGPRQDSLPFHSLRHNSLQGFSAYPMPFPHPPQHSQNLIRTPAHARNDPQDHAGSERHLKTNRCGCRSQQIRYQQVVIAWADKQPVRLDMAFPDAGMISRIGERMIAKAGRRRLPCQSL